MDYDKKSREFMELYSNLPIKTRGEIVVVVMGEPLSWNVAKKEIENNTQLAKEIVKKLIELKIL